MTLQELKTYVRMMLNAAFPKATIQFERVGDDPFHIGVGVYGVPSAAVKWVEDKILDIDEKVCANTEFVITPLVRDEETTEKFYPEFSSAWKVSSPARAIAGRYSCAMEIEADDLEAVLKATTSEWQHTESAESGANEELALAA